VRLDGLDIFFGEIFLLIDGESFSHAGKEHAEIFDAPGIERIGGGVSAFGVDADGLEIGDVSYCFLGTYVFFVGLGQKEVSGMEVAVLETGAMQFADGISDCSKSVIGEFGVRFWLAP